MANRAFLMCHNSSSPLTAAACEGDVILAAASYQVPLLWLALFGSEHLTQVEIPMEDIEGNASTGKVPTLFAQVDVARSRYFTVRPVIVKTIPPALHPHVAEWEVLLQGVDGAFLQADLAEIWMMFEEGEFEPQLRDWLASIPTASGKGWLEVLGQANLPNSAGGEYDAEVARFGLRGYGWERPVPWND